MGETDFTCSQLIDEHGNIVMDIQVIQFVPALYLIF